MGWGQEMRRPVLTLRIVGVCVDGIVVHGGGRNQERDAKETSFLCATLVVGT